MIVSLHTAKGLKGEEIMQFYSRLKRDDIDELFKAILTLKTEEDCYRFFEWHFYWMKIELMPTLKKKRRLQLLLLAE